MTEYKFKTVLCNKLIQCVPDAVNNYVYAYTYEFGFRQIGHIDYDPLSNLNVVPIFQSTGQDDINGEDIYRGHLLKPRDYPDYVIKVVYSEEYWCWDIEIIKPDKRSQTDQIIKSNWRDLLRSCEIIGHEDIQNDVE